MKKNLLTCSLVLLSLTIFAQSQPETKAFRNLKFYPFGLVTSTLQLGIEDFSKDNKRSSVAIFGLRYRKSNPDRFNNLSTQQGFDNWVGGTLLLERRFYVPKFTIRPQYERPEQTFGYGIYFAPFLKLDYNVNDIDYVEYTNVFENNVNKIQIVRKTGKINYFGGTGGVNVGYQFTIFQYLYVDAYLGGGLRLLHKTDKTKQTILPNSGNYYSSSFGSGAIETFTTQEGVVPNGGISLGIRW